MGRRMSGGEICAIVEASVNSTIEWMCDCGWTTTSMWSKSISKSRWASMTSRPLLTRVAELRVIIAPIDQVGWLRAWPPRIAGKAAEGATGGSDDQLADLPVGAAPQSLSDRRVLAVDGDEASSGGACGIEDDGPADDERLLVRQGHIGAPGQGGQCRSETGGT